MYKGGPPKGGPSAGAPRTSPRSSGSSEALAHRSEIYNREEGECRWPINVFGKVTSDCNFEYEVLDKFGNIVVVNLPKGTKLYHSTQMFEGGSKEKGPSGWWTTRYPFNSEFGGCWFTSQLIFAQNFTSKTHTLEYTTKCDTTLVFVQNLSSFGSGVAGFEFVKKFLPPVLEKCMEKGYEPQGYLGCNECEIFLFNGQISTCLKKKPKVVAERSSAYID